jgi:hypothetical protein
LSGAHPERRSARGGARRRFLRGRLADSLASLALPSDWSFVAWIAASLAAGLVAADLRLVPVGLLIVPAFYGLVIVTGLTTLGDSARKPATP